MKFIFKFAEQRSLRAKLGECRNRLYWLAYSWCHDSALADDLVQETLSKALARADQLRNASALEPWLLRILTNCWRDHFRTQRDTIDIDNMEYEIEDSAIGKHEQEEIVILVRRAVAALPEGQRQVLTLVDLEDLSYAEVAEVLSIPIGTVMSRLNRARSALKARLLSDETRQKMMEETHINVVSIRRNI